ncbi:hypothetical protein FI667_g2165, partial [Globisporangium splendens]
MGAGLACCNIIQGQHPRAACACLARALQFEAAATTKSKKQQHQLTRIRSLSSMVEIAKTAEETVTSPTKKVVHEDVPEDVESAENDETAEEEDQEDGDDEEQPDDAEEDEATGEDDEVADGDEDESADDDHVAVEENDDDADDNAVEGEDEEDEDDEANDNEEDDEDDQDYVAGEDDEDDEDGGDDDEEDDDEAPPGTFSLFTVDVVHRFVFWERLRVRESEIDHGLFNKRHTKSETIRIFTAQHHIRRRQVAMHDVCVMHSRDRDTDLVFLDAPAIDLLRVQASTLFVDQVDARRDDASLPTLDDAARLLHEATMRELLVEHSCSRAHRMTAKQSDIAMRTLEFTSDVAPLNLYPSCTFCVGRWECSMCGLFNALSAEDRASASLPHRQMRTTALELELPLGTAGSAHPAGELFFDKTSSKKRRKPAEEPPTLLGAKLVYMFVVDEAGTANFLELVRNSIIAAMHSLSNGAYIGFATFSNRIGVYNFARSLFMHENYTRDATPSGSNQNEHNKRYRITDLVSFDEAIVLLGPNREKIHGLLESLGVHAEATNRRHASEPSTDDRHAAKFYSDLRSHNNFPEWDPESRSRSTRWRSARSLFTTGSFGDATGLAQVSHSEIHARYMRVSGICEEADSKSILKWWRKRQPWRWYRPLCDQQANIVVELQFTHKEGFPETMERLPTVQVCQVYTEFIEGHITNNRDEVGSVLIAKRKAHISTYQIGAAFSAKECQYKVNLGALVKYLTAKAYSIRKACIKGTASGDTREFLEGWLVNFLAKYHAAHAPVILTKPKLDALVVDTEFESHTRLRWLTRIVFGLMNSRGLVRFSAIHPDLQLVASTQLCQVSAQHICQALYPELLVFQSVDDTNATRIPLSHLAMRKSGCLFLLDAHFAVTLVCASEDLSTEENGMQFPPPHNMSIHQEFERRIRERFVVPRSAILLVSDPSGSNQKESQSLEWRYFNALLVDECGHAGEDYTSFAQTVRNLTKTRILSDN